MSVWAIQILQHILLQGVKDVQIEWLIWVFALLGLLSMGFQLGKWILHRHHHTQAITFILVVQNGAKDIEGVLRSLMMRTAFAVRNCKVMVMDLHSTDETAYIVLRLAEKYRQIEYYCVNSEEEFLEQVRQTCLVHHTIGCIYDLRVQGMSAEFVNPTEWD